MNRIVIAAALAASVVAVAAATGTTIGGHNAAANVRLSLDEFTDSFTAPDSGRRWIMELEAPGLHNAERSTLTFIQANTLGASEFMLRHQKVGTLLLEISSQRHEYFDVVIDESGTCTEKAGANACPELTKNEWGEIFRTFRAYARSRYPQV